MQVLKSIWAKFGNWVLIGIIVAMAVLQPQINRNIITFKEAFAAGTADYSFGTNGASNYANITTAINALPSQGGLFQFKVGTYNLTQNASGPITRAFGNMTIEGEGKGTFFTGNASFTAGGSNWVFRNLAVNQTSMLPSNCTWDKVYTPEYPNGISKDVNGVYSVLSLNATQVNAPTGRGATYVIAASDAPDFVKAQADNVTTTDVNAIINYAIARGYKNIKLTEGSSASSFPYRTTAKIPSFTHISGAGQDITVLTQASNVTCISQNNVGTTPIVWVEIDHLSIFGQNSTTYTSGNGIYLSSQNSFIHDVEIKSTPDYGIYMSAATGGNTDGNLISHCTITSTASRAIEDTAPHLTITQCEFFGSTAAFVAVESAAGLTFTYNNLYSTGVGNPSYGSALLYVNGDGDYDLIEGNHFNDLQWYSAVYGIQYIVGNGVERTFKIQNNEFHGTGFISYVDIQAISANSVLKSLLIEGNTFFVENGGNGGSSAAVNCTGNYTAGLIALNSWSTNGTGTFVYGGTIAVPVTGINVTTNVGN